MTQVLKILFPTIIAVFLITSSSNAQIQTAIPLGNGKKFACLETETGLLYGKFTKDGYKAKGLDKAIQSLRKQIKKLKKDPDKKQQRKNKQSLLKDVRQCRNGNLHNNLYNPCSQINDFSKNNSRILEGQACSNDAAPVVLLQLFQQVNGEFELAAICSGVVIGSKHLLTAAHCFNDDVGAVGFNNRSLGAVFASRVFIHPNYNNTPGINDLAILKFDSKLRRSRAAIPEKTKFHVSPGSESTVIAGYGRDENSVLGTFNASFAPIIDVNAQTLTTGFSNAFPGGAICSGDSGGPLFIRRNKKWTLVGIASAFTNQCGITGGLSASLFTNIVSRSNRNFIADIVKDLKTAS